jgi:hypothetical protein
MHASIVVKMVINHLNVQNRKKVDHRLVAVAVVVVVGVVVAVEVMAVILNVVLATAMETIVMLVKHLVRRSNSTTMMISN